ncbi:MAG: hypothetical protein WCG10_03040 [Chlamydiota bacterium]
MIKFDEFLVKIRRKSRVWNLYVFLLIKCDKSWDKLLSYLFKYSTRCYLRKSPIHIEKFKNPCLALKYFSDHFGRFSTSKTLIGKVTYDMEDITITKYLFKLIIDQIKSPKLCDLIASEFLTKVLAYRDLQENMCLSIPTISPDNIPEMVEYTLDTIFDLWHNHVAFGLYPKSHPTAAPILLFRGTDFSLNSEGGRASILSDLDPDGPGRRLFLNAHSNLRQWLKQMHQLGKPARVLGHSLGGALAIYTWVHEYTLLSQMPHARSYAFNPPGINQDLFELWDQIPCECRSFLETFVTRGDVISKFGNLVGTTYEAFTSKPLSPIISHEQLIFSQPVSYLVQIDVEQENLSPSRRYYSNIQKHTTSLAFRFGLKHLLPKH